MTLDPTVVPGTNFDLADWKLQLPIDASGGYIGPHTEVKSLGSYDLTPYFYTGSDGAMVLATPVEGATTSGSAYARTELREMDGTVNAAWDLTTGGAMTASLQVDLVPTRLDGSDARIVIGQIHGGDSQLVRLYWDNGTVYWINGRNEVQAKDVLYRLADANGDTPSISLDETFTYSFNVDGGQLTVSVVADGRTYWSSIAIPAGWDDNVFYFKAGTYLATNETNSTGWGQTSFYDLDVSHDGSVPVAIMPGSGGTVWGTAGVDDLVGTSGSDVLWGLAGNDRLLGHGGNDRLAGGAGNDLLEGGAGSDEAVFAGAVMDYAVTRNEDGSIAVTYLASLGSEGTDRLVSVERLRFSNALLLADGSPDGGVPLPVLEGGSVVENAAAGRSVGVLSAGEAGPGFTYTLVDDAGGAFILVDGTRVVVAEGAALDFETQATRSIVVRVTAPDGLYREETLVIRVENANEAPTSLTLEGDQIAEGAEAGQVVGQLSATDSDAGDRLAFTLVDDAGGRFAIVGNQIRVAPGAVLDREQADRHSVIVEVTDAGGLTRREVFSIAVTDVNDAPTDILVTGGAVAENAAQGTVVAVLGANDPDSVAGEVFTYAIEDPSGRFEIVGHQVRVAAGARIDYETQAIHSVTISVSDRFGATFREEVAITVLNEAGLVLGTDLAETLLGTGEEDRIEGRGGDDRLDGREGNDTILGGEGNDQLTGGLGADVLSGGAGNDSYVVDNADDALSEASGGGTDTVQATLATYSLDSLAHAQIENLTFIGSGTFQGTGNGLANTLTGGSGADRLLGLGGNDVLRGNAGADTLDGGAGGDTMLGGTGDDIYKVDSTSDRITEGSSEGLQDVVIASVTYTLASNVEALVLLGAVNGTGNNLDNTLTGSDQANSLSGSGGNDRLTGAGGNDTLSGGTGNDVFVFAAGFGADRVTDFDFNPSGGQDLIDLRAFGVTAATFASRVVLTDLGSDILVTVDGLAGQSVRLTGAQQVANVTMQDFFL